MSYKNPAPFANLTNIANSMLSTLRDLQAHPEGARAFEKWVSEHVDFQERYGTRYKDLTAGQDVPEVLVLISDSFGVHEGELYVESGYTRYIWRGGEWEKDEDF